MDRFIGILGLMALVGIAFGISNNRKRINWRLVGIGLSMQVVIALFVLKVPWGRLVFEAMANFFVKILNFTYRGSEFVFGSLGIAPGSEGSLGFFFAFQVLATIIFFSSLMSILYHLGLMQKVVKGMAWVMTKLLGVSGAESLSVAANVFVGQTEAPLVIRPYLNTMTDSELMALMVGGMATIAGGVLASYVQMLGFSFASAMNIPVEQAQVYFATHLLSASVMAAPATLVVAKIMIPETEVPETAGAVRIHVEKTATNVIEAAANGAADGVRLAINVAGMLLAFIALIFMFNYLLSDVIGDFPNNLVNIFVDAKIFSINSLIGQKLTLELILGWILSPIAFLIGVPWADAVEVGSLIGTKIVVNEFLAYKVLADMIPLGTLSDKAVTVATYALCGFANFSSIAIQLGGIGPLAPDKKHNLAKLGLRAVIGGSIATLMTASIAGMILDVPR